MLMIASGGTQGEMRLNMPADLRAKAEAELLAMLAAEEEEKVSPIPLFAQMIESYLSSVTSPQPNSF